MSMVRVYLSNEQLQVLDAEQTRLYDAYGLKLERGQVVQLLIEQHRLKLQTLAEEEPNTLIGWLWQRKKARRT